MSAVVAETEVLGMSALLVEQLQRRLDLGQADLDFDALVRTLVALKLRQVPRSDERICYSSHPITVVEIDAKGAAPRVAPSKLTSFRYRS